MTNETSSDNMTGSDADVEAFVNDLPLLYNDTADSSNETLNEILTGAQCDGGQLFADPLNPVLQPPILPAYATCIIGPGDGSNVSGYARFTQLGFAGV